MVREVVCEPARGAERIRGATRRAAIGEARANPEHVDVDADFASRDYNTTASKP